MLPQFTLNARIIFFIMVMFATATPASLKKTNDVVIMLKNHERALHVNAGGKVTATDISLAQFFSMESVGDIFSDTFKIALYAKEVGRYLCFRRGKLVGMKNLTRDCHFIESLDHGYFLYSNAYNPLWRVGFTKGLKPVGPRHWKRPQTLKRACFLFVKINAEHFDRNRFTTTTTAAPSKAVSKAATAITLREGHKLHDSKASIIDSISNNYKRTKSANSGKSQLLINSENVNATGGKNRQWLERDARGHRHRKRKHHAKLAAASNNSGSGFLQPKNLVRHHHDQGNGEGRRHQHHREERERKLRLQNQRRQKQQEEEDKRDSEPMPNATNSATPSMAATTLAATASLAPSALNIVAMLAAGRRKRGRRKKHVDSSVTHFSSNAGHHQAMDLQLVAQSPLQAQSQYDRMRLDSTKGHKLRHHHEHNYHQKIEETNVPVNPASPLTKDIIKVQQQNHKYSNINRDSQLTRSSSRRSSSINSNNLSHNYNLNLNFNDNDNVNNINLNTNNNDNINAIPALPKKYLSKNNFNDENLMQQTTKNSTDFNKKEQFSHSSYTRHDQQQQLQIKRSDYNHTSHDLNILTLKLLKKNIISDNDHDDDDHDESDKDGDSYTNDENSNRLLVNNNNNISDNNLQREHLVNRFKPIYLDRIRSHNFNLKFNTNNNNNNSNNSNNNINNTQKQQIQHYKNENNSPISSTITQAANENRLNKIINFPSTTNDSGRSSSSSIKFGSRRSSSDSRSHFITSASATTPYSNKRSHRRIKRNSINDNVTNNNNYKKEESKVINAYTYSNNNNNNYNKNAKSSSIFSSNCSSSSNKHGCNDKDTNVLKSLNDNKVNIFTSKTSKQDYLNILEPSTTAYRNSKLLLVLGQQKILKQHQLQQEIIKLINNPNYYNYNDNDNDNEYDDGEKFKRIQNKYEKIIVQYRSVFS